MGRSSRFSKPKHVKLVPTYLKQNYVDEDDLIALLDVRFTEYKITTLEDGSTMVEAERKLTKEEIEYLQKLKADKEPRGTLFDY